MEGNTKLSLLFPTLLSLIFEVEDSTKKIQILWTRRVYVDLDRIYRIYRIHLPTKQLKFLFPPLIVFTRNHDTKFHKQLLYDSKYLLIYGVLSKYWIQYIQ